jgi:4-carboxymuconolactone decarboxylase
MTGHRISPLPADQWDDAARHALAVLVPAERRNPYGAGTALSTLVRHPDLTKAFLKFSVHLLFGSKLPPRIRELAILRVAHRSDCDYEWSHHTVMGKEAGLSDNDIIAVQTGLAANEFDQAVINAADELEDRHRLSDATWASLSERLDERQRMDLIFTIGGYGLMAMAYNTFGVKPEQER